MHQPSRTQGKPVEAVAAFANLYQRWFDDPRALVEDNRREAQAAIGACVADVLTLWDERARAWLPGAPAILRLEACDVALFAMRGPHVALFFGSVETESPVAGLRRESFRPCSYAIGRTVADLVLAIDEDGLLAGAEAVLDDGGRLLLGTRDPWPLARAV